MDASVEQRTGDGEHQQKKAPVDQPPPYNGSQPSTAPQPPISVVQQPVAVVTTTQVMIGPESTLLVCPFCHESVQTRVDVVSNSRTHCNALVLCLVGGICCFWIPYCMDSCQSKVHYCPKCGAYIGKYDN